MHCTGIGCEHQFITNYTSFNFMDVSQESEILKRQTRTDYLVSANICPKKRCTP